MIFSPYNEYDGWSFYGPYTSASDTGNRKASTTDGTTKTYEPGLFDVYSILGLQLGTPTTATAVTPSVTPTTATATTATESSLFGGGYTPATKATSPTDITKSKDTFTNTSQMPDYLVNALKGIGFDQYFGSSGDIPSWLTKDLGQTRSI